MLSFGHEKLVNSIPHTNLRILENRFSFFFFFFLVEGSGAVND